MKIEIAERNRGPASLSEHLMQGVLTLIRETSLEPGDRLTFRTAGGGGWGDPRAREAKDIERDVGAGLVSPEAAARDYGYLPAQDAPGLHASRPR